MHCTHQGSRLRQTCPAARNLLKAAALILPKVSYWAAWGKLGHHSTYLALVILVPQGLEDEVLVVTFLLDCFQAQKGSPHLAPQCLQCTIVICEDGNYVDK